MLRSCLPFCLWLTLVVFSCSVPRQGKWFRLSGYTQGTTYRLTYMDPDSMDYGKQVEAILRDFDLSLSTYVPESVISRINRGEDSVMLDSTFVRCFTAAAEVYEQTGGAFDITIAPLVNAWGFGYTERADVDSVLVDSLLQFVGMEKVRLVKGGIQRTMDGVMLDMNAIAQGLAVDILAEFFESEGIGNYLVEIGGEVRTLGKNPGGIRWRIGVDKPLEGSRLPGEELEAVVSLSGGSLATSGNYRKFYELDGMKYAHTINPLSGYPVQHGLLSATVLHEDCMHADAYATALMVMGTERSKAFLSERPDLDAMLIYNNEEGDYRVWSTPGMKKKLLRR